MPIIDAPPFMLEFIRGGEFAQIGVVGDLSSPQATKLGACLNALAERGARRLIVDLNHASFTDRAACRPVMRSATHLESLGATLVLTGVNRRSRMLFASCRIAGDLGARRRPRRRGCACIGRR